MWEIGIPSATSKIIRPRRARPAEMVVARCHASSVWRSVGVRRIVREVVRPRAIQRPHRKKNIGPLAPCQRGEALSYAAKDTTTTLRRVSYIWVQIFCGSDQWKVRERGRRVQTRPAITQEG